MTAVSERGTDVYNGAVEKTPPTRLAEWVRLVRKSVARMDQAAFAEAVNVARPTVSNWETGKFKLEAASIEKILRRFPAAPRPPLGPVEHDQQYGPPPPQPESPPARPTFASLYEALEVWSRTGGLEGLLSNDEFVDGLLKLYRAHERRSRRPTSRKP